MTGNYAGVVEEIDSTLQSSDFQQLMGVFEYSSIHLLILFHVFA